MPYPLRFFVLLLVGTVFRQHQAVIEYLLTENQTLVSNLGIARPSSRHASDVASPRQARRSGGSFSSNTPRS